MLSRCTLEVTDSKLLNFLFSVRLQPSQAESLLFLHKKDQSYLLNKQEEFAATRGSEAMWLSDPMMREMWPGPQGSQVLASSTYNVTHCLLRLSAK